MKRAGAVLAMVAAGCGGGGDSAACKASFERMAEILSVPGEAPGRRLPLVDRADGLGAVPGAIVIEVSTAAPPTIRVGGGPAIDWRFGGTNPEVVEEVERLRAAAPAGTPISLDIPVLVDAWGAAQLIEKLSVGSPVKLVVLQSDLHLPPDVPAWFAAELQRAFDEADNNKAVVFAAALKRAAGTCNDKVEAALGKARTGDPVGEDERIVTAVLAETAGCGCDGFDPVAVAAGLHAVIATGKLGWIELRSNPTRPVKVPYARKNETYGELVERAMTADAANRRAGVNLGPR